MSSTAVAIVPYYIDTSATIEDGYDATYDVVAYLHSKQQGTLTIIDEDGYAAEEERLKKGEKKAKQEAKEAKKSKEWITTFS